MSKQVKGAKEAIEAVEDKKEVVAEAPKTVKMLSLRQGDVILPDKQLFKFRGVVIVSEDVAAWLEATFKSEVQRV